MELTEPKPRVENLAIAFAWLGLAYMVAAFLGMEIAVWLPGTGGIWKALQADLVATVVIFAFSLVFRNASFYDPYWSLAPILIGGYFLGESHGAAQPQRALAVLILVTLWGLRLTWNWMRGWTGLHHEDWRYRDLRQRTGKWYPAVNLLGIHLFPTLQVFLGCLSLYPALALHGNRLNGLDALAFVVTAGAILLEAVADEQLRAFRLKKRAPEEILATGVWAWCRHPNYLGEILFWWGLYLFGLAASRDWWWTIVGPLAMTLMFVFISIPMIDNRMKKKRPAYAAHIKQVPALLPRLIGRSR
ncbi:MAG: DUF1295 domain-containing protein [Bacteroidia bacterium]|nr:DUF1295 domain-containing protein [Bacteroidia bacterium]